RRRKKSLGDWPAAGVLAGLCAIDLACPSMKVCTLLTSASRLAGGLHTSVRRLSQELLGDSRFDVSVLALSDAFSDQDLGNWTPLGRQLVNPCAPRSLGYSQQLIPSLHRLSPHVLHIHGIWQYLSYATLRSHQLDGRPYVISPRGMLDPWALR